MRDSRSSRWPATGAERSAELGFFKAAGTSIDAWRRRLAGDDVPVIAPGDDTGPGPRRRTGRAAAARSHDADRLRPAPAHASPHDALASPARFLPARGPAGRRSFSGAGNGRSSASTHRCATAGSRASSPPPRARADAGCRPAPYDPRPSRPCSQSGFRPLAVPPRSVRHTSKLSSVATACPRARSWRRRPRGRMGHIPPVVSSYSATADGRSRPRDSKRARRTGRVRRQSARTR